MSQTNNYLPSTISFDICLTGITLLHAHPRVVYYMYNCVKFHQYLCISLGGVVLMRNMDRRKAMLIVSLV